MALVDLIRSPLRGVYQQEAVLLPIIPEAFLRLEHRLQHRPEPNLLLEPNHRVQQALVALQTIGEAGLAGLHHRDKWGGPLGQLIGVVRVIGGAQVLHLQRDGVCVNLPVPAAAASLGGVNVGRLLLKKAGIPHPVGKARQTHAKANAQKENQHRGGGDVGLLGKALFSHDGARRKGQGRNARQHRRANQHKRPVGSHTVQIERCQQDHQQPNRPPQPTLDASTLHTASAVCNRAQRTPAPEIVAEQHPRLRQDGQQQQRDGDEPGVFRQQGEQIPRDTHHLQQQQNRHQNHNRDVAGQKVFTHTAVDVLQADRLLGLERDGVGIFAVKNLHLTPLDSKPPARTLAVFLKGLLVFGRPGVKIGGLREVGHRKAQPLRLDSAVGPEIVVDPLNHPPLLCHPLQMAGDALIVVKGKELHPAPGF